MSWTLKRVGDIVQIDYSFTAYLPLHYISQFNFDYTIAVLSMQSVNKILHNNWNVKVYI